MLALLSQHAVRGQILRPVNQPLGFAAAYNTYIQSFDALDGALGAHVVNAALA